MESRIIFESNKTYISKVAWLRKSEQLESEWVHYGKGDKLNIDLIIKAIKTHLENNILQVSVSRQNSFSTTKEDFLTATDKLLGTDNFEVWDYDFKKVIQFNNIGVFRVGSII